MIFSILTWAMNFSLVKFALREFAPLGFNGLRMLLASLFLMALLFLKKEKISLEKVQILPIIFLGIVGNTVYQLLFIHGINLSTASNTSLVMSMSPIFVAILSSISGQEKIHWAGWLGILLSFIGFYLVALSNHREIGFQQKSVRGELLILGGNLCWALYTVYAKPLLEKMSPLKLSALTLSIGTLFYLPFCKGDFHKTISKDISFASWAALIYSFLLALVFGYLAWYSSVKRIGNSKTAIYNYMTPVFAVFFAHIFLAESISFLQICGALTIFIGVYFTRSGYRLFLRKLNSSQFGAGV